MWRIRSPRCSPRRKARAEGGRIINRTSVFVVLWLASWSALAADWIDTWGASPLPPSQAVGPLPGTPSFADQTVRQIVRLSAGGDRLRLRLTNEYGAQPVEVGATRVALVGADGDLVPGSEQVVTFAGKPAAATIAPYEGVGYFSADGEAVRQADLIVDTIGAMLISVFGWWYMRRGSQSFIELWIQKFIVRNPALFKH
jgi:hypothetical protein